MLKCGEYVKIRQKYFGESKTKAKRNYESYKRAQRKMNTSTTTFQCYDVNYTMPLFTSNSFATVEVGQPVPKYGYSCKQEEGNNPMNYATATVQAATTETQDQRKYLTRRLDDIFYQKERPLYAAFGLTDDEAPTSPKELKKRLADGKFTIIGLPKDDEDEDEDEYFYGGWSRLIRWRDPAKKADQEGYDAARKELKSKYQEALDTIKIDDVKAGLDAVKALEAWTPTGAAN